MNKFRVSIFAVLVLVLGSGTVLAQSGSNPGTNVTVKQGAAGASAWPVSAASLPLPTGAATSALQTTGNTTLGTINTTLGTPFQAGGALAANQSVNLSQIGGATPSLTNPLWVYPATGATFPVSAASLPLPSGAATEANQTSVIGPIAPGASATSSMLIGGLYVAAGVTLTDGQQAAFQFDSSGNLKTSGTFSGSIAAGLIASSSPPSYSAGAQALSGDLAGDLRVILPGAQAVTASSLPLPTGAATSALQTTINSTLGSPYQSGGALPLPTGAATSGLQITSNTTLGTINTTLGTPMQTIGGTVGIVAVTTGGGSQYHLVAGASTNSVSVKSTAGKVSGLQVYTNGAVISYLKLYDTATAPTCNSDTVVKTIIIPATSGSTGSGANLTIDPGAQFSSGIGICVTGGIADNDNTAVAASSILINIDYK